MVAVICKSLSSTEAELTFPREVFRGYKCLAGRDCNDAIQASGRACGSLGVLSCWLPYGLSHLLVPTK